MKKVRNFIVFPTVGILMTSLVACSKDDSLNVVSANLSKIENMSISNTQSVSTALEENMDISISEEASEFLDSDCVAKVINEDLSTDYQELVDTSYMYFSQRLKEDNPEDQVKNLYVSYKNSSAVVELDGQEYTPDSVVGGYLDDVKSLQQGMTSDNDLTDEAKRVVQDMMLLSTVDIETNSAFVGKGQVFVKAKK